MHVLTEEPLGDLIHAKADGNHLGQISSRCGWIDLSRNQKVKSGDGGSLDSQSSWINFVPGSYVVVNQHLVMTWVRRYHNLAWGADPETQHFGMCTIASQTSSSSSKKHYGITLGHRAKPNRRDGHCDHAFQAAPFPGIRHITDGPLERADTKWIICKIKLLLYAAAEGLDETLDMKMLLHDFTAIQKGEQDFPAIEGSLPGRKRNRNNLFLQSTDQQRGLSRVFLKDWTPCTAL